MKLKRIVIGTVVAAFIFGGGYLALGSTETSDAAQKTPQTSSVKTAAGAGNAVIADGKVVPVKSAEIGFLTGGMVADVPVSEGDRVAAGQLLVKLDAKQQAAAVAQAEASLARARAALSRAKAASAQLRAGTRDEDLATARAAVKIAEAELARLQKGADKGQLVTAQVNMGKAQRAVQQAQLLFDQIAFSADVQARPEGVKLEQATLDYEAAKAQYEQLKAGPNQAEVNVALARVEHALASLAQLQASARPEAVAAAEADVAAAEADVAAAEAGLKKAQDAMSDAELRAPFAGTILTLNAKTGELVSPTSFVVRLADVSAWEIETQDLTELNVPRLHQGDPVTVEFDAIPELTLGGKISRINEYGKNKQGDTVYTVYVKPDQHDERLRWNMTAEVSIK